ncbi:hypothetical protein GEMRC1_004132 [Eukaryota sp. GEM-RC1]
MQQHTLPVIIQDNTIRLHNAKKTVVPSSKLPTSKLYLTSDDVLSDLYGVNPSLTCTSFVSKCKEEPVSTDRILKQNLTIHVPSPSPRQPARRHSLLLILKNETVPY